MYTRRTFLWTLGAGLGALAGGKGWAQTVVPAPAPMDVVTQFIAARATQDYAKAYALLSADTQSQIPYARFVDGSFFRATVPQATQSKTPPEELAFYVLFMDTHNTMNYTFKIVGANPHMVVINAQPMLRDASVETKPILLQIAILLDTQAFPRMDLFSSYAMTGPDAYVKLREQAQVISSTSNLKLIGLCFIQYNATAKHLPDASQWMDAITPILGSTNIDMLRDQSAPKSQQFSYAFNRALSGVNLDSLANPSGTVLAFTSTLGTKNAADTGQSLPAPGWHTGGSIVVFCNGLARWVKDGTPLRFTP